MNKIGLLGALMLALYSFLYIRATLTRRITVVAGASFTLLLGVRLRGGRVVGQLRRLRSGVARNVRSGLATASAVRHCSSSHKWLRTRRVSRFLPEVVEGDELVLERRNMSVK